MKIKSLMTFTSVFLLLSACGTGTDTESVSYDYSETSTPLGFTLISNSELNGNTVSEIRHKETGIHFFISRWV